MRFHSKRDYLDCSDEIEIEAYAIEKADLRGNRVIEAQIVDGVCGSCVNDRKILYQHERVKESNIVRIYGTCCKCGYQWKAR